MSGICFGFHDMEQIGVIDKCGTGSDRKIIDRKMKTENKDRSLFDNGMFGSREFLFHLSVSNFSV